MIETSQQTKEQIAAQRTAMEVKIKKQVEDLCDRFRKATADPTSRYRPDNSKGSKLYNQQVDFAYMIHEITAGPTYIASKVIGEANKYVDQLAREASRK